MGVVMFVRHSHKGDGTNAPKNQLSPEGMQKAWEMGKNLPAALQGLTVRHVGGSVHSRSVMTALQIAIGAGADPLLLPSRMELGSEGQFFRMTTLEKFNTCLKESGGNVILATRSALSPEDYNYLQQQLIQVIREVGELEGVTILGTHNPWIQLILEVVTGQRCDCDAPELSYVVVGVADNKMELLETSLH